MLTNLPVKSSTKEPRIFGLCLQVGVSQQENPPFPWNAEAKSNVDLSSVLPRHKRLWAYKDAPVATRRYQGGQRAYAEDGGACYWIRWIAGVCGTMTLIHQNCILVPFSLTHAGAICWAKSHLRAFAQQIARRVHFALDLYACHKYQKEDWMYGGGIGTWKRAFLCVICWPIAHTNEFY